MNRDIIISHKTVDFICNCIILMAEEKKFPYYLNRIEINNVGLTELFKTIIAKKNLLNKHILTTKNDEHRNIENNYRESIKEEFINNRELEEEYEGNDNYIIDFKSFRIIYELLIDLNYKAKRKLEKELHIEYDDIKYFEYIAYDEIISKKKVSKRGKVYFVKTRPFIQHYRIHYLLKFTEIEDLKGKGIVSENHEFGYHFHYGYIEKGGFVRTNMLLTFIDEKKNELYKLFAEKHSEKNTKIYIDGFPSKIKKKIYDACEKKINKVGILNFKRPSNKANLFYPE